MKNESLCECYLLVRISGQVQATFLMLDFIIILKIGPQNHPLEH
jgi:hypothetical protein